MHDNDGTLNQKQLINTQKYYCHMFRVSLSEVYAVLVAAQVHIDRSCGISFCGWLGLYIPYTIYDVKLHNKFTSNKGSYNAQRINHAA